MVTEAARRVLHVLVVFAIMSPTGCGDTGPQNAGGDKKSKPTAKAALLPPAHSGPTLVLEAEDGTVEASMVIEDFTPQKHPRLGVQRASGGKCVSVPKDANKACKLKKEKPKGKVTMKFSVPEDGTYYIYPRTWWSATGRGCSNSFGMILDDRKPLAVTDATYGVWHWIKFKSDDPRSTAPRPFKLKKGEHTLTFTNREDDTRLDQVYITSDAEDGPAGIMK